MANNINRKIKHSIRCIVALKDRCAKYLWGHQGDNISRIERFVVSVYYKFSLCVFFVGFSILISFLIGGQEGSTHLLQEITVFCADLKKWYGIGWIFVCLLGRKLTESFWLFVSFSLSELNCSFWEVNYKLLDVVDAIIAWWSDVTWSELNCYSWEAHFKFMDIVDDIIDRIFK